MKKVIVSILAGLGIIIACLLIFAATKPDTFRVERTTSIKAPPEKIFALISDFRAWNSWSPYDKLDTTMKRTYTGSATGKGAVYAWEGNNNVGAGRMEITDTTQFSKIVIKLDFIKPFEGHNVGEFTIVAKGDATIVTWGMHGPSPYISKLMSIFFNMDTMIGKDFEKGLNNLKNLTEK
jgi:uncharacterized protein YndB with AHSA1/START domain